MPECLKIDNKELTEQQEHYITLFMCFFCFWFLKMIDPKDPNSRQMNEMNNTFTV